jgi:lipopolysaccharide transport system ATP-binding protein
VTGDDGSDVETVDIGRPVGIEVRYDVLKEGWVLVPNLHFFNEQGVYVFVAADYEPGWRGKPRPSGRYTTTAWVPGNLLAEGTLIVGAALSTLRPEIIHFYERDVVAFQVVDSTGASSTRGDYGGTVPGVVRPLLRWTTAFTPGGPSTEAHATPEGARS